MAGPRSYNPSRHALRARSPSPPVTAASPSLPASQPQLPAPVQASILFLAIRGFAGLAQAEQARHRQRLQDTVDTLLAHWRDDTRIVLETEDGAAIVGLTGPVRVLEAAHAAVAQQAGFGIALHHGAVRALQLSGQPTLTGDGLETARAVARRPGEHPPTATRPFRRALQAAAPERMVSLRAAGDFMDERLRNHELYELDPAAGRRRGQRRLLVGAGIVTGLLGLGVAVRLVRQRRREAAQRLSDQTRARPGPGPGPRR
jgi:hypothetical protein